MDKMISVINDNLNSIINGVVTHRKDTEKALSIIESDISDKIAIANSYKESVAQSQAIITNLENEISALEKDLEELTNKFNEIDFKEIIAAGNKEINGKIIEKRAQIQEQTNNIIDLTEKAQHLKDELVKLNEKKDSTTENLKNSCILEKYYSKRINSIIEYAVEHKNELENYVEIDSTENLVESVEIDKDELVTPVDDSIFTEIDSLAKNDIDEEMLESVLSDNINVEIEENSNEKIENKDYSIEEQLDNIISSATSIIEKTNKVTEEIKQPNLPQIEVLSQPEDIIIDNIRPIDQIEVNKEKEENELTDEEFDKKIDEELDNIQKEYENNIKELNLDNIDDEANDDFSDPDDEGGITIDFNDLEEAEENEDKSINELNFTNQMTSNTEQKDINTEIIECGLDINSFEQFELQKFKSNFNLDNTKKFIDILNKHKINKTVIYDSVDVINEVTPQNLDIMLSQIEKLEVEAEDIKYIFKYLNKINMSKLENSIRKDKNRELTEILIEAIDIEQEINIKELFNLDNDELKKLKSSSIGNDFKIINTFPEVVLENYNTLKALRIDNLTDCFIKYPHRFILNPSNFKAILDKYDTEDLIRCINKNSAVINRL